MVQQELANLAEIVWTLLHSAQRDGQCFYPSQSTSNYIGAFSFCGLTALLGHEGGVRLQAHDLDVVLLQDPDSDEETETDTLDVAGAHYKLAFYKGNPAFLKNWHAHITGLQVCFHAGHDTTQIAV